MALIALIQIGRPGKLLCMPVVVAVGTKLKLDLVECVLSLRRVTLTAFQAHVPALQRICSCRMFLDAKLGRLESVNRVTRGALAAIGSFRKLPTVRVWLMAIRALIEGDSLLEVTASVALNALHLRMLSEQRILCLRVIEILIEGGDRDFFPTRRRVAGLAGLFEAAVMDIGVAVSTLAERNPGVTRLSVRAWRMALLASDLGVQSSQRISRLGMVELLDGCDRFPVGEIVALLAVRAEAALVRIFVTSGASLGNAEEGLVQILDFYQRTIGGHYMLCRVAAVARQARVFGLQRISGLLVVKGVRVPLHDRKIFSVVVGVAAHAALAGTRFKVVSSVEAAMCGKTGGDLRVTFQTLESWLPSREFVARCTVARAA